MPSIVELGNTSVYRRAAGSAWPSNHRQGIWAGMACVQSDQQRVGVRAGGGACGWGGRLWRRGGGGVGGGGGGGGGRCRGGSGIRGGGWNQAPKRPRASWGM